MRRGIVITHDAWYDKGEAGVIANNPVIAISGPPINRLSAEFEQWKPEPPFQNGRVPNTRDGSANWKGTFLERIRRAFPKLGLWGRNANATRQTVERRALFHKRQRLRGIPEDMLEAVRIRVGLEAV
jgi:hypothetical protein